MFNAQTFTNNGTAINNKSQINLATFDGGNHSNAGIAAIMAVASLAWNQRGVQAGPNRPARALGLGVLPHALPTIECISIHGNKCRYTVGASAPCDFAGTGLPTNAAGIEGFTLKIERLAAGSEVPAFSRDLFIPFYAMDNLLANTAIDAGNITAL